MSPLRRAGELLLLLLVLGLVAVPFVLYFVYDEAGPMLLVFAIGAIIGFVQLGRIYVAEIRDLIRKRNQNARR